MRWEPFKPSQHEIEWIETMQMVNGERAKHLLAMRLNSLGYEIDANNPIMDELFKFYRDGDLYSVVETAFKPVLVWNPVAEGLLKPYARISID